MNSSDDHDELEKDLREQLKLDDNVLIDWYMPRDRRSRVEVTDVIAALALWILLLSGLWVEMISK